LPSRWTIRKLESLSFVTVKQLRQYPHFAKGHQRQHICEFELFVQASRVRFRFEADALEVVIGDKEEKSDNKFVGGENRWKYDTFTNWEFWWPNFPVLVYFKETQTKPEGQIHFFPIIFNGKQLYDVMSERCGASQTSGPK